MAPADGKLYALRDVTGTVESLPLIASSIMSKKIAAGTNCIVLDVKHGKGAFMKNLADATALAQAMVEIGEGVGRKVRAVLSSMEQPLGYAVGNALEVKEAVETLQGRGPADLVELALILGSQLLEMSGQAADNEDARRQLRHALDSGAAFEKYKAFVAEQGGDVSYLDDTSKLPLAPHREEFPAPQAAYIQAIDAETIGIAAYTLGAGRKVKTDAIDPAVGLVLRKKVGERVEAGESLLEIHAQSPEQANSIKESLLEAYIFSESPVKAPPLIDKII
jgi:pyrimidine-nucleoside phosphorylase